MKIPLVVGLKEGGGKKKRKGEGEESKRYWERGEGEMMVFILDSNRKLFE